MTGIWIAVAIIGATGLIGGTLLSVVSALCDTGEGDSLAQAVREALPGANCGACGYAGCDAYAEAVAAKTAEPNLCAPGGAAAAKALSGLLGVEVEARPMVATVCCHGTNENTGTKYAYDGMASCAAATALGGGPMDCAYGCIGFGDCVRACGFDAIHVENGVAVVDPARCTGCSACAKACPKGIIHMGEKKAAAVVPCSNHQKGAAAKKICAAACIGCTLCMKNCEYGAIEMHNFVAVIHPEKCTACGKCVSVCPQKIIQL